MKTITTTIYEPKKRPQEISVTGESRFKAFVGPITVRYGGTQVTSITKVTELQVAAVQTLLFLRSQSKNEATSKHIANLELVSAALYEVASGGSCKLEGRTTTDEMLDLQARAEIEASSTRDEAQERDEERAARIKKVDSFRRPPYVAPTTVLPPLKPPKPYTESQLKQVESRMDQIKQMESGFRNMRDAVKH